VIVLVLGSAAGGGVPQWNCACANCAAVRSGRQPSRLQSSFAFSADGEAWYLVNVSPDVAAQIEANPPLHPRTQRGTPIAGAFFTDANVDHLGGLAVLRQQGGHRFVLRSSAVVRAIATRQQAFAAFGESPHAWYALELGAACEPEGGAARAAPADAPDPVGRLVDIWTIPVPGVTPGYDGRRDARGAVVAYEVVDRRTGGRVLFAPVFAGIDEALRHAMARADVAFLDGSFYSDDEMPRLHLGDKQARGLGHQPVEETLPSVAGLRNRKIFAHLNNSNPMLDPDSPAALAVAEAGAEIAYDRMQVVV
jgi:pyrroloquinoline quinone biosynthesis protein B